VIPPARRGGVAPITKIGLVEQLARGRERPSRRRAIATALLRLSIPLFHMML
jgi:hypothetical protein